MDNVELKKTKLPAKRQLPQLDLHSIGCQLITCLGCVVPILLIIGTVILLVLKPAALWEPTKQFLNQGIELQQFTPVAGAKLDFDLTQQLDPSGQISLNEEQFAALAAPALSNLRDGKVALEPGRLRVLTNLEQTGQPLWLQIVVRQDGDKFTLESVGLGRLRLPGFMLGLLRDSLGKLLDLASLNDSTVLLGKLLAPGDLKVTRVRLEQDKIIISLRTQS